MGLFILLKIAKVDDGTQFDVGAANTALMANSSFGELYHEFLNDRRFTGPFRRNNGELEIAQNYDSNFEGYGSNTMVWGCYGADVFQAIADYISEGKIAFEVEIEGNDNEFYICTPGTVIKKMAADLL